MTLPSDSDKKQCMGENNRNNERDVESSGGQHKFKVYFNYYIRLRDSKYNQNKWIIEL